MSESRKTIFAAIIISLVVGTLAGVTGGIVATQLAYGDLGGQLANMLPQTIRQTIIEPSETATVQVPNKSEGAKVVEVVEQVSPAVVSITVTQEVTPQSTGPLSINEFFREFGSPFRVETPQQPQTSEKRQVGSGTGFIITADGLIATNKHVAFVDNAEYTVITAGGEEYKATVLARDPFIDLAILKVEAKGLPTVKLGDSDKLRIGETVIAIGNALAEFSNTITKGVVSGINRRVVAGSSALGTEVIEEAIQTDAAINPGNSGGPLVNLRGEVVGINTAVSHKGQLIGFAIPINVAKPAIKSIKEVGKIVRPWIGVRYVLITSETAQKNNLPVDYGALLVRGSQPTELAVTPSSPASKAGLREADIILEINGIRITQEVSLARQIQKYAPGDEVVFKVLSQGEQKEIKVKLEEYPL